MVKEKDLREILRTEKKVDEIIAELSVRGVQMSPRMWRKYVREYNDDFAEKERYIASGKNGYVLTTKKKVISASAMNRLKCGVAMIKNAKADLGELALKDQLKLSEEDAKVYDIIDKLGL